MDNSKLLHNCLVFTHCDPYTNEPSEYLYGLTESLALSGSSLKRLCVSYVVVPSLPYG